MIKTLKKHL